MSPAPGLALSFPVVMVTAVPRFSALLMEELLRKEWPLLLV